MMDSSLMVVVAKKEMRKKIAGLLKTLTGDQIKQKSADIFEKLQRLAVFQDACRISVYLSTDTEVDTTGILRQIFSRNTQPCCQCFVPRFDPAKSQMEMVCLKSMKDYELLPAIPKWNIKQPSTDEQRENAFENGALDLVIVPGVAFTVDGHRLGHGKGYYDRFLSEHRSRFGRLPVTVALAFREQIVDVVPTTERDICIDTVLTD